MGNQYAFCVNVACYDVAVALVAVFCFRFEGICLSQDLDKLAGMNLTRETPSLYQISIAVMKKNTRMVI